MREKEFRSIIGKKLKDLRLEAGFTNSMKFCQHLDISREMYRRLESGYYKSINVDLLIKVCEFHNVGYADLFRD